MLKLTDDIDRFDPLLRVWCDLAPAIGFMAPTSPEIASYFPSVTRVRASRFIWLSDSPSESDMCPVAGCQQSCSAQFLHRPAVVHVSSAEAVRS